MELFQLLRFLILFVFSFIIFPSEIPSTCNLTDVALKIFEWFLIFFNLFTVFLQIAIVLSLKSL